MMRSPGEVTAATEEESRDHNEESLTATEDKDVSNNLDGGGAFQIPNSKPPEPTKSPKPTRLSSTPLARPDDAPIEHPIAQPTLQEPGQAYKPVKPLKVRHLMAGLLEEALGAMNRRR
jgi:hypothetical protein